MTSAPAGIDCGSTCVYDFDSGSGRHADRCARERLGVLGLERRLRGTGQCQLTMNADHLADCGSFSLRPKTLTVSKAGAGSGSIASGPAGIDCGASCAHAFDHGATVTLTATAGTRFDVHRLVRRLHAEPARARSR